MNLAWLLAWRFRGNKRQNGFISFISASSTFGIGLGCFVLIVLLSVMNGFEKELKNKLLSVIPHGEFSSVYPDGIADWSTDLNQILRHPHVTFAQPYIKTTGMLQKGNEMKAVQLTGIDPLFASKGHVPSLVSGPVWQRFIADSSHVLLGAGVMSRLGLNEGDSLQVLLPQLSDDLRLSVPKTLRLTVVGSIDLGGELSNHLGYMHMSKAADAQGVTHQAQGLMVRFDDPFQAPRWVRDIGFSLQSEVYMSNWTMTEGNLYQDIQLVRVVVYIALVLVIGVACFNIVSTLVMAVNEKQSEIAMLKSMGAKHGLIIAVFMFQGLLNGLVGTSVGVILGVVTALYLADIARALEGLLGTQFLSGDIYFIDFLPSQLVWHEVYVTAAIALGLSVLATLYPSIKAARINPANVLGH